jgi:hypothetical protein
MSEDGSMSGDNTAPSLSDLLDDANVVITLLEELSQHYQAVSAIAGRMEGDLGSAGEGERFFADDRDAGEFQHAEKKIKACSRELAELLPNLIEWAVRHDFDLYENICDELADPRISSDMKAVSCGAYALTMRNVHNAMLVEQAKASLATQPSESKDAGRCRKKEPPKHYFQIYQLARHAPWNQADIAQMVSQQLGRTVHQSTVSKALKRVGDWLEVNPWPDHVKISSQDPASLDAGWDREGRTPRQRRPASDD